MFVVAAACALALLLPAASGPPTASKTSAVDPAAVSAVSSDPAESGPASAPSTTVPATAPRPTQTSPVAASPAQPSQSLDAAPPEPSRTEQATTVPASAPTPTVTGTAAPEGPPEPRSIPPLYVPPTELTPSTQPSDPTAKLPDVSAQALVPNDNSAQILAVFTAINNYRQSLGIPPVKYNATVSGLSQEWANSIATREVIEHRPNFWTDARALNPDNGAGEVIAVRWDRDAAQLVEWWKGSPAHDALLRDPRFNVIGVGIAFTDGDWRTTPNRYTMWGVVNLFGYKTLPAGTTTAPGGGSAPVFTVPAKTVCDPAVRYMPPTQDLRSAEITSASDLLSVDSAGRLINRPFLGGQNYGPPKVIGGGFSTAIQIFLTDWDRDGAYDVLAQWADGRVTLHAGVAGGGFRAAVTLGQSGWAGMTIALGQWCGNNRLPQILAKDASGNLWLYQNTGLGDLAQRSMVASGISAVRLAMVDFDGDGYQDLLALNASGDVLLYRGAGVPSPRAEARKMVATGWSDVTAIRALRDVTGLNSTGLAVVRGNGTLQYWDLGRGTLSAPSALPGFWAGMWLAQ